MKSAFNLELRKYRHFNRTRMYSQLKKIPLFNIHFENSKYP